MYVSPQLARQSGQPLVRRAYEVRTARYRRPGLGETPTFGKKLSSGVAAGVSLGVMTGMQSGPIAGAIASGLAVVAPFTGPAAPFLILAAGLVGPIAAKFGCGPSCVQATQFADQAADAANKLVGAYWAQPVRYASTQAQTLAYLNQIADWLRSACSDPSLGNAGVRCISERLVRGGTAPWCPSADHTGCDYYTALIDPIANDTGVTPDPSVLDSAAASVTSLFGGANVGGVNVSDLILPALLIGAALML